MKLLFNLIFALLVFSLSIKSYGQFAVNDPVQTGQNATMIAQNASILEQSIESFKKAKELVDQGKKSYQEFVQIKTFMETVEQRMQNIGDIKNLRLNKIEAIMDRVLCIKTGDYYPKAPQYFGIVSKIQNAFNSCDNRELYSETFAGKIEHLENSVKNKKQVGKNQLLSSMNEFNSSMKIAQNTREATSAYNSRMKLELGLKYKAISDELVKLSDEIHLAINIDAGDSRNIPLSPSERMKMMDMANQYQIQALEYEEKSVKLLKESSELDRAQQKQLLQIKRDLAFSQLIRFTL